MSRPPSRIPYWIRLPLMMALLFLISLAILRSNSLHQDLSHDHASLTDRKFFPNLVMVDESGETTQLSQFKGKVTLVSFWATWCPPCIEELPYFSILAHKFPDDLKIVAINQDQDPDVKPTIDRLWEKYRIPFKTYYDPEGKLAKQVRIEVLPTNYLLDRQGKLVFIGLGSYDWKSEKALKLVETLIGEPAN